jgi:hypothetical protein
MSLIADAVADMAAVRSMGLACAEPRERWPDGGRDVSGADGKRRYVGAAITQSARY